MQIEGNPKENAPHQIWPTAKREQSQTQKDQRHPVKAIKPHVKSVLHHVRRVARHRRSFIWLARAPQNPSHVRPPTAVARCVRITRNICMSVMDAMGYDPVDGPAFKCERAAEGQKVLDQLWRLVATMSQESVKTHSDPQACGNPPEQDTDQQRPPTEHKERGHRTDMEERHEDRGIPLNALGFLFGHRLVAHSNS